MYTVSKGNFIKFYNCKIKFFKCMFYKGKKYKKKVCNLKENKLIGKSRLEVDNWRLAGHMWSVLLLICSGKVREDD